MAAAMFKIINQEKLENGKGRYRADRARSNGAEPGS